MFLDDSFPPDSRVENEAFSLVRAGHEVFLFSLDYKSQAKPKENIRGIQVCRYASGKLIYKLSALAYTIPFYHQLISNKIRHFLMEIQPDVLHIHDMLMAQAVMDVNEKQTKPIPVVLDLHENRPEIMQYYPHLQKFPGKFLIKVDRWRKKQVELIKRADKVILVTPEAVKVAMNQSGEPYSKFIVVPNTIEKDIYFNYPIDQKLQKRFKKGFDIVYVGDTGLRRGTDTAIRAMKKVIEQVPQAQLILVGKSSEEQTLLELVDELGLSAYVAFEGWQDVSTFPSYIWGAEVCISPLKRNLHHDTTYANKIFQYMAGKRPLLVSDCDSQAVLVKSLACGLVFEADNAEAMAQSLIFLYKNPTQAREMGERGFDAVSETYHWEETSKELLALYASSFSDQ